MKKNIYFLLSLATMMVSINLMGQTNEEIRSLEVFNTVKISNSIEAELVKGDKHEVEITASGIELERIDTKIDNRTLEVKVNGSNFSTTSIKVKITYVEIDEITASTGSKVFVKDVLQAKEVKISAYTASYLEAEVNVQNLYLEANTNAKIFIDGTAEALELEAYTTAEINGEYLEVEEAQVKVNTAAHVNFTVHESLKGSAATAGKAYYKGDPRIVDVKTNTGGAIERKK
ncbi:MAG: head GIN domain-containing protein [Anditalea sp.]